MTLDLEFKKHLSSLRCEVFEDSSDEFAEHKAVLIFNARATLNRAAVPSAYKDAALYSMEQRVRRAIDKYIEAVELSGISIDTAFENEMLKEFWSLTSGPNHLQFPPMIFKLTLPAIQQSYAIERGRLAKRLVNVGTNRLRELKMRMQKANRATQSPISITNNIANSNINAPVGNALSNSTIQTTNSIHITAQILNDIDHISECHPELQAAASEIRNVHSQGGNAVDKIIKWAALATTITGLAEKIHQFYPHLEAFFSHFKIAIQ
jgi:hypothetical protein